MTEADTTRLSNLTTDALRAAGDKTVDDVRNMLKTADEMHAKLHRDGEQFIADIGKQVLGITDSVSAYVAFCQQTVKMFNAAGDAARKLNGAVPRDVPPAPSPSSNLVEEDKTRRIPRRDWEGELSKVQTSDIYGGR
jgi:hypothetical protein